MIANILPLEVEILFIAKRIADARKTYLHRQVKHSSGSHSMRDSTHGHFLLVQHESVFSLEHRQPRHRRVPGEDSINAKCVANKIETKITVLHFGGQ